jgi:ATP-dependent DNA ligase
MTFSPAAKKSAGLARSIKTLLGQSAYERYKQTGQYDRAALEAARQKKRGDGGPNGGSAPVPAKPRPSGPSPTQAEASPEHQHVASYIAAARDSGRAPDFMEIVDAGEHAGLDPNKVEKEVVRQLGGQSPTQAEVRPDSVPTHSQVTQPAELTGLTVGDIVRDKNGLRIRVQKKNPTGLRIHDAEHGARDQTWDQLHAMGLKKEEKGGQAARRIGELRDEAIALGIDVDALSTKKEIEVAIGKVKATTGNELDQIDPMLASDDVKKTFDFQAAQPWRAPTTMREYWNNDEWVAGEKYDGVRLKLHITPDGIRADSRRPDTKTRRFSEKSANFGHLQMMDIPALHGTVIDTEGMIPTESGVLPSGTKFHGSLAVTTAATNAGPETSMQIQEKFGPMQFWIFDTIKYKGEDVSQLPFEERRKITEKVRQEIIDAFPPAEQFMHLEQIHEGEDKLKFFESIIGRGGEGVMLKRRSGKYEFGKRSKNMEKVKRFQEVDAFVNGYVPGKGGNEGYVGALELAVKINGKKVGIAAVSQLTEEQRKEFTAPDGSLKKEIYNKVVTFRGQELAKNGRFRHAILVGFREDKPLEAIDGYEVVDELRKLKPELFKDDSQDTFL